MLKVLNSFGKRPNLVKSQEWIITVRNALALPELTFDNFLQRHILLLFFFLQKCNFEFE